MNDLKDIAKTVCEMVGQLEKALDSLDVQGWEGQFLEANCSMREAFGILEGYAGKSTTDEKLAEHCCSDICVQFLAIAAYSMLVLKVLPVPIPRKLRLEEKVPIH